MEKEKRKKKKKIGAKVKLRENVGKKKCVFRLMKITGLSPLGSNASRIISYKIDQLH